MAEMPYLLCSTDASGQRYAIHRLNDGSMGRYIRRHSEGQWEVEDGSFMSVPRSRVRSLRPSALPAFPDQNEAALFSYMEDRYYHATVGPSEDRVQIRVSPNFGGWSNCPTGQWVSSLHREDGRCAGGNRCSASVAEAKVQGLHLALGNRAPDADQLEWTEAARPSRDTPGAEA